MDKIKFKLDFIEIEYTKGDINEALKELNLKDEDINWSITIKLFKKKIKERIEWDLSEYGWNWLIDSIDGDE